METTKNSHSSAKYPKRKQFGKCPSFGQTAAHFHSVGSAQPNSLPLSAKTLFQWRQSKSILMRLSITICYFSRIHQFGCVADVHTNTHRLRTFRLSFRRSIRIGRLSDFALSVCPVSDRTRSAARLPFRIRMTVF
jgi:hypothetical protein